MQDGLPLLKTETRSRAFHDLPKPTAGSGMMFDLRSFKPRFALLSSSHSADPNYTAFRYRQRVISWNHFHKLSAFDSKTASDPVAAF